MHTDISKEEALSLLRLAALEPLGTLVYVSDAQPFIQALYRAKREDPSLQFLQIRQTPEGVAICHDPISYPPLPSEESSTTPNEETKSDETDNPRDKEISPVPLPE